MATRWTQADYDRLLKAYKTPGQEVRYDDGSTVRMVSKDEIRAMLAEAEAELFDEKPIRSTVAITRRGC